MYKLLSCSLLALPLATRAQTPGSSLPLKAYVGVGVNGGRYYDKRYGEVLNNGLLYSPTVVAGLHLTPTLTLQLGANMYNHRMSYTAQGVDYSAGNPNNPVISYTSGTTRRRYYIVPLLVRYTFAGSAQRMKLDGLLGITIYHTREHSTTTHLDSQFQVTNQYAYSRNATYANLLVGIGARYALLPKLELASEVRINPFYFGYSVGAYPNVDLSIRYCFGTLQ
ncbi:outer membrane beta-barrel protein [Hymenobacter glacieicola]|uniref:Outer membrane protein beta-barrel domain-containing protein n=1 Tax=Hymenobacter glacieicola TaxID=1562124 RepID=A0ABQ1WYK7_9BACT|nr:outer membrane beta-barrel protein [Hymenobacter glacieicola]GGG50989.1 hypothetical protein GCM10011378_28970 [Hymenobacter glacieicola]